MRTLSAINTFLANVHFYTLRKRHKTYGLKWVNDPTNPKRNGGFLYGIHYQP